MEKLYVSKIDEVYLYIQASPSQSMELKEHFSYYTANYIYHPKVRQKIWDGRVSMFKWQSGLLPVGLYKELIKFGKKFQYEIVWDIPRDQMITDITDDEIYDFYKAIFKDSEFYPRDYQDDAIHRVLKKRRGIIESPTGCHATGTKILMFDGSFKNVENISVGDKLMGPDGNKRTVLKLYTGNENMYRITPKKGNSFVVNENHILHLKNMNKKYINNIDSFNNVPVIEYINKSNYYKNKAKLVGNDQELTFNRNVNKSFLNPYFIGLYLGDGSVHSCSITTMDDECVQEIYNQSDNLGGMISESKNNKSKAKTYYISFPNHKNNLVNKEFKKMGLNFGGRINITKCQEKFIPDCIKYGSINDRYELLAGLIDSDGSLNKSFYTITIKSKKLRNDISFVARSLGFFCTERTYTIKGNNYYQCSIMGYISKIPVKVNRKKYKSIKQKTKSLNLTGFEIECVGKDNFYGFELDKDHLYMTDDFIIHHNSGKSLVMYCLTRFLLALDKKILLIVPNIGLTEQLFSDYIEYGWKNAESYVSVLHGKSKKYNKDRPILVSTWQSIYKKKKDFFKDYDAVIVDEVHGAKAYSLQQILEKCVNADYRVGLTGTLQDQECDRMSIIGHLGPVLFSLTAGELIDKGILSKIKIANLLLQYTPEEVDYMKRRPYPEEERFIAENEDRNKIFKYIIDHVDKDDNILILVRLKVHLHAITEYLKQNYPDKHIHEIFGETDVDVRESVRKGTNDQAGVILVATYATMSQGINIKRIHHVIFGSSFKSKIRILQSIGRGLRKHPLKKLLLLFDIIDDLRYVKRTGNIGENHVFKHFRERLKYYTQQGFKYTTKKVKVDDL